MRFLVFLLTFGLGIREYKITWNEIEIVGQKFHFLGSQVVGVVGGLVFGGSYTPHVFLTVNDFTDSIIRKI